MSLICLLFLNWQGENITRILKRKVNYYTRLCVLYIKDQWRYGERTMLYLRNYLKDFKDCTFFETL